MVSSWCESIDLRAGRPAMITHSDADDSVKTYELRVLGGQLREELFIPTSRTRLVIRCERSGAITMRIREGRSSGV